MIQSYEDLEVYKRSYKLSMELYQRSRSFPDEEKFMLTSQLRRAVTSIPLNIAEGYGKKSSAAEFKRYLAMAAGSSNEVAVLLDMSKDLGFIKPEEHETYKREVFEIGRMLNGLIRSWK